MMESDLREAQLKRGMAKAARQVIGLADHTKIGEVFIASSLLPDEMHTLITDQGLPAEQRAAIEETGLRLEVV